MPGQDTYVAIPDGSYVHIPADATGDQISQLRNKLGGQTPVDPLTAQTQAAARSAGTSTASTQPLDSVMRAQGQKFQSSLGPQARIEQLGTDEQKATLGAGLNMDAPIAAMTLGTTSPVATIAEKGLGGYVGGLAKGAVQGAIKSAAGSEVGKYVGRGLGGMLGGKGAEIGSEVGQYAGGIAGPFVPNSTYARLPMGLGHLVLGNEDYAEATAARKVAQREADISAGIRKTPDEIDRAKMQGIPVSRLPNRISSVTSNTSGLPGGLGPEGSSSGQDLITRMNKIYIPGDTPTEDDLKRAGDYTQAPIERLRTLAGMNDKLAQKELGRRLKN